MLLQNAVIGQTNENQQNQPINDGPMKIILINQLKPGGKIIPSQTFGGMEYTNKTQGWLFTGAAGPKQVKVM